MIPTIPLIAYSSLIFGAEIILYATLAILPSFYAVQVGGMRALSTALFASGVVYTCGGPIVGYLSDRIPTPWGRRKPWIAAGTVMALISVYLLFVPPAKPTAAYFGWSAALALLAFSFIDVPYLAWGAQITRDYRDRSRVATFRSLFTNGGVFALVALPLIPGFGGHSFLNALVVSRLGLFAFVTLFLTTSAALLFGPESKTIAREQVTPVDIRGLLGTMASNRPLRLFLLALAATWFSIAFQITLGLPFLASLGLADWFSSLTIFAYVIAILTTPLWLMAIYRFGKKRAWAGALAVQLAGIAAYIIVSKFDTKAAVIVLTVFRGIVLQSVSVIPYSLLGDVIDYDSLRTRANHASSYTAVALLVIRLPLALSGAIGFALLSTFHYKIGVPHQPFAQAGMSVAYLAVPAVCALLAIVFVSRFPLDARKQSIIRRRLEGRGAQTEAS